jgi:hypothetical protein
MKRSIFLIFATFLNFYTCLNAQNVERMLWHTFQETTKPPTLVSTQQSNIYRYKHPESPDFKGGCVFSLETSNGQYRVFHNGIDLGQFPGDVEVSQVGDILLLEWVAGQKYVRVNGQKHGPFKEVQSYESINGHVVVKHRDPATQTNYLYIDSTNVAESKSSFFYWGATPPAWTERNRIITDIHTLDSLICQDCSMPNFSAAGNHYFLIYYTKDKNAMHCIVDGKDIGMIESYWAPQIDSYGNLYMPCEIKGNAYVKTEKTLFGPVKSMQTMKYSSGQFGLLFKFQKKEDPSNRAYLYDNGNVYGPWDTLVLFGGSNLYYYEKSGSKFLGREGKVAYSFEPKSGLKNIAFNTAGQYMFECWDGTVFLNDKELGNFLNIREMWLHETGNYFLLYGPKSGTLTANINGKTTDFDAADLSTYSRNRPYPYTPGPILLDETYRHFLLSQYSSDFFIIDGKQYPCIPEKTKFFYEKSINSFCWTTIEGNEIYWHTLKLD